MGHQNVGFLPESGIIILRSQKWFIYLLITVQLLCREELLSVKQFLLTKAALHIPRMAERCPGEEMHSACAADSLPPVFLGQPNGLSSFILFCHRGAAGGLIK